MAGQWDAWRNELRAAGKGGAHMPQLAIDRGRAWSKQLRFGHDFSADAFACNLALSPDGTTLVSPAVDVGSYTGGYTIVTLSLTAAQTANVALIPADGDLDGVEGLVIDVLRTPDGETDAQRLLAGTLPVIGKV